MRNRTTRTLVAGSVATLASALIVMVNLNGGATAYAVGDPGCITQTCPTVTPSDTSTPSDSASPTDTTTDYPTAEAPQPTETDLTPAPTDGSVDMSDPMPSDAETADGTSPDHPACDAGWVNRYTDESYGWHFPVGIEQTDRNRTSSAFPADFSETTNATVGISFSGTFEGKADAFIVGVKTTFGITVHSDVSVTVGNTVHPIVKANSTLYGVFGVWRERITGSSEWLSPNCTVSGVHSWVGYGPISTGWDVWEN